MNRFRMTLAVTGAAIAATMITSPVQAAGVTVGSSTLIGTLDYSDTFTLTSISPAPASGARPDTLYNDNSGGGYNVETAYGVIEQALYYAAADDWVYNFKPTLDDYDRSMVLVRPWHRVATLMRGTQRGPATYAKELVESKVEGPIDRWEEAGRYLGRHGLAILSIDGGRVTLGGCNPDLAKIANRLRYMTSRSGLLASKVIAATMGRRQAMRRLHDGTRLRAAEILEDRYPEFELFKPKLPELWAKEQESRLAQRHEKQRRDALGSGCSMPVGGEGPAANGWSVPQASVCDDD